MYLWSCVKFWYYGRKGELKEEQKANLYDEALDDPRLARFALQRFDIHRKLSDKNIAELIVKHHKSPKFQDQLDNILHKGNLTLHYLKSIPAAKAVFLNSDDKEDFFPNSEELNSALFAECLDNESIGPNDWSYIEAKASVDSEFLNKLIEHAKQKETIARLLIESQVLLPKLTPVHIADLLNNHVSNDDSPSGNSFFNFFKNQYSRIKNAILPLRNLFIAKISQRYLQNEELSALSQLAMADKNAAKIIVSKDSFVNDLTDIEHILLRHKHGEFAVSNSIHLTEIANNITSKINSHHVHAHQLLADFPFLVEKLPVEKQADYYISAIKLIELKKVAIHPANVIKIHQALFAILKESIDIFLNACLNSKFVNDFLIEVPMTFLEILTVHKAYADRLIANIGKEKILSLLKRDAQFAYEYFSSAKEVIASFSFIEYMEMLVDYQADRRLLIHAFGSLLPEKPSSEEATQLQYYLQQVSSSKLQQYAREVLSELTSAEWHQMFLKIDNQPRKMQTLYDIMVASKLSLAEKAKENSELAVYLLKNDGAKKFLHGNVANVIAAYGENFINQHKPQLLEALDADENEVDAFFKNDALFRILNLTNDQLQKIVLKPYKDNMLMENEQFKKQYYHFVLPDLLGELTDDKGSPADTVQTKSENSADQIKRSYKGYMAQCEAFSFAEIHLFLNNSKVFYVLNSLEIAKLVDKFAVNKVFLNQLREGELGPEGSHLNIAELIYSNLDAAIILIQNKQLEPVIEDLTLEELKFIKDEYLNISKLVADKKLALNHFTTLGLDADAQQVQVWNAYSNKVADYTDAVIKDPFHKGSLDRAFQSISQVYEAKERINEIYKKKEKKAALTPEDMKKNQAAEEYRRLMQIAAEDITLKSTGKDVADILSKAYVHTHLTSYEKAKILEKFASNELLYRKLKLTKLGPKCKRIRLSDLIKDDIRAAIVIINSPEYKLLLKKLKTKELEKIYQSLSLYKLDDKHITALSLNRGLSESKLSSQARVILASYLEKNEVVPFEIQEAFDRVSDVLDARACIASIIEHKKERKTKAVKTLKKDAKKLIGQINRSEENGPRLLFNPIQRKVQNSQSRNETDKRPSGTDTFKAKYRLRAISTNY